MLGKVGRVKLEGHNWKGTVGREGQTGDDKAGWGHSGTGCHLYARGRGPYFRSELSVRFSTSYRPLLQRRKCAHGAAQGVAEGVNGVLRLVPRVCTGCAPGARGVRGLLSAGASHVHRVGVSCRESRFV